MGFFSSSSVRECVRETKETVSSGTWIMEEINHIPGVIPVSTELWLPGISERVSEVAFEFPYP